MKVGAFQTRIAQKLRQLLVLGALAICVCSLFPAGATQTASALTMCMKTARGGLEVGAIWTPAPEIDPPPKTAVLTKLLRVSYAYIWQSQSSYRKLEVRPKIS